MIGFGSKTMLVYLIFSLLVQVSRTESDCAAPLPSQISTRGFSENDTMLSVFQVHKCENEDQFYMKHVVSELNQIICSFDGFPPNSISKIDPLGMVIVYWSLKRPTIKPVHDGKHFLLLVWGNMDAELMALYPYKELQKLSDTILKIRQMILQMINPDEMFNMKLIDKDGIKRPLEYFQHGRVTEFEESE